jgi:hypothetical protein
MNAQTSSSPVKLKTEGLALAATLFWYVNR